MGKIKKYKFEVKDKIGHLEILEVIPTKHMSRGNFKCLCDCGNIVTYSHSSMYKKRDCGCITPNRLQKYHTVLLGKRSGKLLAVKHLRTENYSNIWLCKCDCGNYSEVAAQNFNFRTQSCGRCTDIHNNQTNGYMEIPLYLLTSIKKGAKERDLEYTITYEEIWEQFILQERKCALSGRKLTFSNSSSKNTASLDRINSKSGYVKGNIQWVHKHVNIAKNRYSQSYFIQLCNEVYTKNKNSIEYVTIPSWTDYFLGIAKVVATRSKDAQTQVGCVITTPQHHIIGTGYNSFPPGMPDTILPNIRPDKYKNILHAEKCALLNLPISPHSIMGGINMYITVPPCFDCFNHILNCNVNNIFSIDVPVSPETAKYKDEFELLLHSSNINYYLVNADLSFMSKIL